MQIFESDHYAFESDHCVVVALFLRQTSEVVPFLSEVLLTFTLMTFVPVVSLQNPE